MVVASGISQVAKVNSVKVTFKSTSAASTEIRLAVPLLVPPKNCMLFEPSGPALALALYLSYARGNFADFGFQRLQRKLLGLLFVSHTGHLSAQLADTHLNPFKLGLSGIQALGRGSGRHQPQAQREPRGSPLPTP